MLKVITGLVGLGLAIAIGTQVLASNAAPAKNSADPRSYPRLSAVPGDVLRDVAGFDIQIDPIATSTAQLDAAGGSAVTPNKATDVVRARLGLGEEAQADSITLATVTTGQYGKELEPDPTKPSRIDPAIKGREAWVVTFSSATMPLLGKQGYKRPTTATGPLLALVDHKTGEFLYAIAY